MYTIFLQRRICHTLVKLGQAERSGKPEAAQKAYEDLFALCYENQLYLPTLLREWERHVQARVA